MRTTYSDFVQAHLVRKPDEPIDGYRYFRGPDVTIYPDHKTLTFRDTQDGRSYGVPDFPSRKRTDETFMQQVAPDLATNFASENQVFHDPGVPSGKSFSPEVGGRVALTHTPMYMDESGAIFAMIPLAHPDELYGGGIKLPGSHIIRGAKNIDVADILRAQSRQSSDSLQRLQQGNPGQKIIELIPDFRFGDWTVRFLHPNGTKYSQLKNAYITRAPDGAYEVLTASMHKSYEEFVSHYQPHEDLAWSRLQCVVRLSSLLEYPDTRSLQVEKLFFGNTEITTIDQIPDAWKGGLSQDGNTFSLNGNQITPPAQAFIRRMRELYLDPQLTKELTRAVENIRHQSSQRTRAVLAEDFESPIAAQFHMEKNTTPIVWQGKKSELLKNIATFPLVERQKTHLSEFVSKMPDDIILESSPDFVIGDAEGYTIWLEAKNSEASTRPDQRDKMILLNHLLHEGKVQIVFLKKESNNEHFDTERGILHLPYSNVRDMTHDTLVGYIQQKCQKAG